LSISTVFALAGDKVFKDHFTGFSDDFRPRAVASSADWIKVEYDQSKPDFLAN
jgi:hypothetical protein